MRKCCVFTVKPALGGESGQTAADVCEETVSKGRFGCYLQYLRPFGSETKQTAADVCEVTVAVRPGPRYLRRLRAARALGGENEHFAADVCEVTVAVRPGPQRAPPQKCERGDSAKVLCFYSETCSWRRE